MPTPIGRASRTTRQALIRSTRGGEGWRANSRNNKKRGGGKRRGGKTQVNGPDSTKCRRAGDDLKGGSGAGEKSNHVLPSKPSFGNKWRY